MISRQLPFSIDTKAVVIEDGFEQTHWTWGAFLSTAFDEFLSTLNSMCARFVVSLRDLGESNGVFDKYDHDSSCPIQYHEIRDRKAAIFEENLS